MLTTDKHIEVRNLEKTYKTKEGDILALKDASFDVRRGEFVTVLGPSGCGKSTLLMLLAGILPKTSGSILVDGVEVTEAPSVGMVFQYSVLLPWRSVIDNVLLPIEFLGKKNEEYYDKALDLLKLTGLAEFAKAYPWELSGGMQQRASICRGLIHDPPFVLMDEPFGALDAMTRERMNLELLKIWSETKKTIIFVTHSIPEAIFLADRVLVMTPRPGTIAKIIDVDLPRPRTLETQNTVEFAEYAGVIREVFSSYLNP